MTTRRRAGVAAAGLGVAVAATSAGVAVTRRLRAPERREADPYAGERLGQLPGRSRTVRADDGIGLHVIEGGNRRAAVTVVFVHGYCLAMGCWHFQWRDLAGRARLVAYDQRSHGRSERGGPDRASIEQLGADLGVVLDAVAPRGPVVMVGHSMGGMTVMSLAERCPEIFGGRVTGVALVGTSAGRLGEVTFGLPAGVGMVTKRVLPWAVPRLGRQAGLIDHQRKVGSELSYWLTKRFSFGSDVSPSIVAFAEELLGGTPFDVIAEFFPAFARHDKLAALDTLRHVETLVLVGERDLMTPAGHSREIAAALPSAELAVVPRAGHLVMLEFPDVVSGHLRALVERATRRGRVRRTPA